MKIVIDIPEKDYKQGTLGNVFRCYSRELDNIIYNGTVLLKKHRCLDKISTEIMAKSYQSCDDYFSRRIIDVSCVLEIINKYKVESEEEE